MSISHALKRPALVAVAGAAALAGVVGGVPATANAAPEDLLVELAPWTPDGPAVGAGLYQLPGKPQVQLHVQPSAMSSVTDVTVTASEPGATKACSPENLPNGGEMKCMLDLAPLKNGETRTLTVTITGKRDGVDFTRVTALRMGAADVRARTLVNGQDATTKPVVVRGRYALVQHRVTNRSAVTLHNVKPLSQFHPEGGQSPVAGKCTIAVIRPGATGSCTFLLSSVEVQGPLVPIPGLVAEAPKGFMGWFNTPTAGVNFINWKAPQEG